MKLPTPADAYCNFPGRSRASAMRSLTDLSGRSGWTEITFGAVARIATGANDFPHRKITLWNQGLMVIASEAISSV